MSEKGPAIESTDMYVLGFLGFQDYYFEIVCKSGQIWLQIPIEYQTKKQVKFSIKMKVSLNFYSQIILNIYKYIYMKIYIKLFSI